MDTLARVNNDVKMWITLARVNHDDVKMWITRTRVNHDDVKMWITRARVNHEDVKMWITRARVNHDDVKMWITRARVNHKVSADDDTPPLIAYTQLGDSSSHAQLPLAVYRQPGINYGRTGEVRKHSRVDLHCERLRRALPC